MRSLAAVALACLVAMTGAHAQNTAKSAATPGAQGARPLAGAAPGPAYRPQGTQRSLPPGTAAQTPQGKGSDLSSEQARRMQEEMEMRRMKEQMVAERLRRDTAAKSNMQKKQADTAGALISNMK